MVYISFFAKLYSNKLFVKILFISLFVVSIAFIILLVIGLIDKKGKKKKIANDDFFDNLVFDFPKTVEKDNTLIKVSTTINKVDEIKNHLEQEIQDEDFFDNVEPLIKSNKKIRNKHVLDYEEIKDTKVFIKKET